jgi:PKD repeat protein
MGMTVSHAFARAGTYDVTVTATNAAGSQERSVSTVVVDPVDAPEIVALSANPSAITVGERVGFESTIRGTEPITCRWDFGDGATSTSCDASHTYSAPGTYTATLTATNSAGSDSRSVTVTVAPIAVDPCDEVVDMSTVFFRSNSSVLTDEARARLLDNVAILNDCPGINVQVDAYASPGESNPQRLSDARARAVEQFYLDNGVAASRIMAMGRGVVEGVSRKEDGSIFRYATTTPIR